MSGNILNLPPGIRINGSNYLLDFSYHKERFRITTKLEAKPANLKLAAKILNMIKLDIERNQFYSINYQRYLANTNALKTLDANSKPSQCNVNLGLLFDEQMKIYYQRVESGNLALSTVDGYQYLVNLHLRPFFEETFLSQVNHLLIEKFINMMPHSKKHVSRSLRPLREIMKRAKKQELIEVNPFDILDQDVMSLKKNDSDYEVDPFSLEEMSAIINNCQHQCVANIIQTGFWTGMRIGELFALAWEDIDFHNEYIRVDKALSTKNIIRPPKTKSSIRTIEMIPKAKEALLNQFQITGQDKDNRVFKSPKGATWKKTDSLGRYWRSALNKAAITYRNPYQMRHTFISYMLSIGNSPMVLYRMVGHCNPKTLYEKYARFIKTNGKLLKTEL